MAKKKKQGDNLSNLVTDYCKQYPNMLTLTLAKHIYKEHQDLFTSVEQIRTRIRTRRGAHGIHGKSYPDELKREQKSIKEWMQYFTVPSEDESTQDFIIPKTCKSTLLFSDVHLPYHNLEAITTMFEYADGKIDSIIINGDLIDFYRISRFTQDPTRRNLRYEFDIAQEFLEMLRSMFPDAKIFFKLGNHEERYEVYLKSKAPQLFGDEYFDLENRLNLKQLDIHYIKSRQLIKYGKLNVIHGHEFGGSFFNPVNPARGLFLRSKCSTIAGHNHQTSEHHENNLNGRAIATWSTGCLCELRPEYMPFAHTKWNLGFAMLKKDADGNFEVDNKRILDGRVI